MSGDLGREHEAFLVPLLSTDTERPCSVTISYYDSRQAEPGERIDRNTSRAVAARISEGVR
jgi:hypothetical protein